MAEKNIIVVCVDRDNDLGRKTGIVGPVVGREKNLQAAIALALADPTDSDANSIFASIKKFDEVSKIKKNVEIVTITGHDKFGFQSDIKINEQLDWLDENYSIESFVVVSDGAEDDQIIPLLQGRGKILSKELVIVKQAKPVESIYYTIREALRDPFLSRIVFGIPGIILVVYTVMFAMGAQQQFFQGASLILGIYLLFKGFGIENKFIEIFLSVKRGISIQRASFPFYIGSFFIFIFGLITGYSNLTFGPELLLNSVRAFQGTYLFTALALIFAVIGRSIDTVHLKRAYELRKYFLYVVSTILIWFLLDSGTLVFLREADLNFFLLSIMLSFIALLLAFRVADSIDVRNVVTELLMGLPVYSHDGEWLGKVNAVDRDKKTIGFKKTGDKNLKEISRGKFELKEGKIVLISTS